MRSTWMATNHRALGILCHGKCAGFVARCESGVRRCYGTTAEATIESCTGRAFALGAIVPEAADFGGVLSSDPAINPDFFSWNAAFLHYCDGASFGSNRRDPINVTKDGQPTQIWMRGRANFDALIDTLQSVHGMASATEIVLSGGSAGGLAVFYNLDHLADLVAPHKAPVSLTLSLCCAYSRGARDACA